MARSGRRFSLFEDRQDGTELARCAAANWVLWVFWRRRLAERPRLTGSTSRAGFLLGRLDVAGRASTTHADIRAGRNWRCRSRRWSFVWEVTGPNGGPHHGRKNSMRSIVVTMFVTLDGVVPGLSRTAGDT